MKFTLTAILGLIIGFSAPSSYIPVSAALAPPIAPTGLLRPIPAIPALPQTQYQPLAPISKIYIATAPSAAPSTVSGCGDNEYANFIYMHESGCNLNAVNAGGCRGLGQACPGSKLPCGADYTCQNAWFTDYANSAYGGWAGAYQFWLGHSWW